MKLEIIFFSLLLAPLSGCLGSLSGGGETAETAPSISGPTMGPRLVALNFPYDFGIVLSNNVTGSLLVRENDAASEQREHELYLRVIDSGGTIHNQVLIVPPQPPGSSQRMVFEYPKSNPPFLIFAECGCSFVWLENYGANPDIQQGLGPNGEHVVQREKLNITVEYQPYMVPNSPSSIGADNVTFQLNSSILHWRYQWDMNMQGEARLLSPHGRELARWEVEGRQVRDGHVSNGSKPLSVGDWRLEMDGVGWFQLAIEFYYLPHGIWDELGVKRPD